jgi:hypothetical protein
MVTNAATPASAQYGGPVEAGLSGDVFECSHLSQPYKGEATVHGDEMKGRLQWWSVGEFRLRRIERSPATRP